MKSPVYFLLALCGLGKAQQCQYLDKNQVKTQICYMNYRFWDPYGTETAAYLVPKTQSAHASFANALWIGGLDGSNQLHMAANTYRQYGSDFWPGPLDTTNIAHFDSIAAAPFQRVWKIDCNDIDAFVQAYKAGSVTAGTYTVPEPIVNYPAKGTGKFQKNMAPFYDANMNGVYDPVQGGDYPLIKGHQQILSVYNDQHLVHTETNGAALGIEVHEYAYAFHEPQLPDSMQAVNFSTFYHFEIYNRSSTNYHNVYMSDWADVDLGYFLDDYIGTDTVNKFAYCYNSNNVDVSAMGMNGYHNRPPVLSEALIPIDCSKDGVDNDHDQLTDEQGETFSLDHVSYYNTPLGNVSPNTTQPVTAVQYYQYQKSQWKNGAPFTYGANATAGTVPAPYVYTGNPQTQTGWTESNAKTAKGDRRLILTSGPFNFPAKSKIEWGFAVVFSQDTTGGVNSISQFNSRVRRDVKNVLHYNSTHAFPQCANPLLNGIAAKTQRERLNVLIYPNPATTNLQVILKGECRVAQVTICDVTGKTVLTKDLSQAVSEIDISLLPAGIYMVEIKADDRLVREKLIRQ